MEGFAIRKVIAAASAAALVGGLLYGASASAQQQQQQMPSASGSQMGSGTTGQQSSPALSMSTDDIKKVQEALKDKGHDVGEIDGVWGPKTQSAVRDFQQKEGIGTSGDLDQQTIQALGVDVSSTGTGSSGSMGSGGSMGGGSTGSMGGSSGGQQRTTP